MDSIYQHTFGPNYGDSLGKYSPQMLSDIATEYRYSNDLFESRFTNQGRAYSYGLEYSLRYDPATFWNGWVSLAFAKSMRRDNPAWRWYPSDLDRPVVLSLVNYYRLPRTYEVSVKYRFMSGFPYTSAVQDSNGTRIGTANDSRYSPYQRLDFKFSKGFTIKDSKGHFYIEIWNAFNTPNFLLTDSKTRQIIGFDANWLITMLFCGIDYQF
jgi:outer membrane receptor protein involved in Fe transport